MWIFRPKWCQTGRFVSILRLYVLPPGLYYCAGYLGDMYAEGLGGQDHCHIAQDVAVVEVGRIVIEGDKLDGSVPRWQICRTDRVAHLPSALAMASLISLKYLVVA